MQAKMKCSNCGAEMSNMNFSWGKRQWLLMIPVMVLATIGFYPVFRMTFLKGDITKDLVISDVEKRVDGSDIEIVGLITNQGRQQWKSIKVEAEFFDAADKFIDEQDSYLNADIQPEAKEHFKITVRSADSKLLEKDTKMVVKISGGFSSPF